MFGEIRQRFLLIPTVCILLVLGVWLSMPLVVTLPNLHFSHKDQLEQALIHLAGADEYTIYNSAVDDFNGDGKPDIIAHIGRLPKQSPNSEPESYLVVGVGKRWGTLKIVSEIRDGMLPVEGAPYPGLLKQSLKSSGGKAVICEEWGKDWVTRVCSTIILSGETLRVLEYSEITKVRELLSNHSLTLDFVNLKGQRTREIYPDSDEFPVIRDKSSFSLIVALPVKVEAPVCDGELSEEFWKERRSTELGFEQLAFGEAHWSGTLDFSAIIRTGWDRENLYFAIEVTDDFLVLSEGQDSFLHSDNVELWFDTSQTLLSNEMTLSEYLDQDSESKNRFRWKEHLKRFVGVPSLKGLEMYVMDHDGLRKLGTFQGLKRTPTSTVYEIRISKELLGLPELTNYEQRWQGIGFTVLINDVDDPLGRWQETGIASSSFKWASPFSFGLLVLNERDVSLPNFPFDWAKWIGIYE